MVRIAYAKLTLVYIESAYTGISTNFHYVKLPYRWAKTMKE